jgi:hypothetical protein
MGKVTVASCGEMKFGSFALRTPRNLAMSGDLRFPV